MNFNLTDEQLAFKKLAKDFAKKEFLPHASKWDEEKIFPKDVIKRSAEQGFCSLYVKEDIGGMNLSRLDTAMIFEELSHVCPSTTAYISIHNMTCWMIDEFGSEILRKKYGEKMAKAELLGSYCLTEPWSGSDAASLKARAKKEKNEWVLNGTKAFVSGAGDTDVLIVMARTGEEGPRGISSFVVPAKTKGISYGKNENKMGWNSQPTRIVNLDQVRIPEDHLLGELGQGFKIAMRGLNGGRINIAACSLGAGFASIEHSKKYMEERKQFGKTLSSFQALQFKLADMLIKMESARQMTYLAAFYLDQKHVETPQFCAMAKKLASDNGFFVCNEAMQIFGGYGYMKEYPVERLMRDARVHQILEGTNEIMSLIISRSVFKK